MDTQREDDTTTNTNNDDDGIEEIPRSINEFDPSSRKYDTSAPRMIGVPIQMGQFPFGQLFAPFMNGQQRDTHWDSARQNDDDDDNKSFSMEDHIEECKDAAINPFGMMAYRNWLKKVLPCDHKTTDPKEITILQTINSAQNKHRVRWDEDMLQWVIDPLIASYYTMTDEYSEALSRIRYDLSKCDHCKNFFIMKK
jgi:hypothetical protein